MPLLIGAARRLGSLGLAFGRWLVEKLPHDDTPQLFSADPARGRDGAGVRVVSAAEPVFAGRECQSAPSSQTLMSELFPKSTKDVIYAYAFEVVGFSKLGMCTLLAFTWPILSVVIGRKWMESRFSWIYHFVELALCAGTCYILTILTFWAEWLYGGYVVAISIGLFACTALVFLCCSLWAICRKWWTKVRGSREQGRGIVDLAASG